MIREEKGVSAGHVKLEVSSEMFIRSCQCVAQERYNGWEFIVSVNSSASKGAADRPIPLS